MWAYKLGPVRWDLTIQCGPVRCYLYLQNSKVDRTEREEVSRESAVMTVTAVKNGADRRLTSLSPP